MKLDPRVVRSRAVVLEAARNLLRDKGFRGVTVQAVADTCGVAKTTIYRQWADRNELLLDTFESFGDLDPLTLVGTLREDLCALLNGLVSGLVTSDWAEALPALAEAAERDSAFRPLCAEFVARRRRRFVERLERAVSTGELAVSTDIELVVSLLAGPLFYRRLITRQPLDSTLVSCLVDVVIDGLQRGESTVSEVAALAAPRVPIRP